MFIRAVIENNVSALDALTRFATSGLLLNRSNIDSLTAIWQAAARLSTKDPPAWPKR